jgi:hypothetical protein
LVLCISGFDEFGVFLVGEGGFEGVTYMVENEAEAGLEKHIVEACLGGIQFLKLLVFPVRVVLG